MNRLYLITDESPFCVLYQKLTLALETGCIALLQYRRKTVPLACQANEIECLLALCQQHNTPFIINDNMILAQQYGVGVHLGQQDGTIGQARICLQPSAQIGSTCHDSLALVKSAVANGASYAALGAVYPSATKPNVRRVSMQTMIQACQLPINICLIGGLTVENIAPFVHMPIRYFAVIQDILGRADDDISMRCYQWHYALRSGE